MGATGSDDLAAALGRHASPKAMTTLAYNFTGLIGSFHNKPPSTDSSLPGKPGKDEKAQHYRQNKDPVSLERHQT